MKDTSLKRSTKGNLGGVALCLLDGAAEPLIFRFGFDNVRPAPHRILLQNVPRGIKNLPSQIEIELNFSQVTVDPLIAFCSFGRNDYGTIMTIRQTLFLTFLEYLFLKTL